ncbi:MAG: nucleotidyltransferase domain-containing protein [Dechloromonas sp.]|nr:nucleotidyltransferase domain-containing protein [Dechloromonas sp.]
MLNADAIAAAAMRAAAAASSPSRVVLFGSYARGTADEGSDLDLLVVQKEVPDRAAEYLRLRRAIGAVGTGVDVVVCSEQEAARRARVPGTLVYWAMKEGRVLHDALA